MTDSYRHLSLEGFLDAVAARTPAPGGGGAAAVTIAMAAGLVAMAGRFSAELPDAAAYADRADMLRERALTLADEDARAYGAVLAAYRLPREPVQPRRERIQAALRGAAGPPARIAEAGAEVASLAADLAERGNRNLRGDAMAAALLADAAVRASVRLARLDMELADSGPSGDALLRALGKSEAAAADAVARLERFDSGMRRS